MRLTGIDAPEMADTAHGPRAMQALTTMTQVGDTVQLESDVRARDQYNRVLAYVWHHGAMLNQRMVREGWALPYTVPPNVRYEATFRSAQREARSSNAGLWREDGFACPPEQFRKGACGR